MSSIGTQVSNLFFPPAVNENTEISFDVAIEALDTRRLARITKAALFALSSIIGTVMLVLTETAVITWPIGIPLLLVTLVCAVIFYRLNSLDTRYVEALTDQTKERLIKHELDRILLSNTTYSAEEVTKSLKNVNRLLDMEAFDKKDLEKILSVHSEAMATGTNKSLAEFAFEQNKSLKIESAGEWFDQGRFGLASFKRDIQVIWSGNPADSINVTYKSVEKDKNGDDIVVKDVEKKVKKETPDTVGLTAIPA